MNPKEMNPLSRIAQLAPLMLVVASTALATGAYMQAINYPFISDDIIYIIDGAKLAKLRLVELWRLFAEPYNDFFEFLPLRDLSFWFDMTLFGPTPSAFRAHNILLYVLCLPLAYATTLNLWRYFRPADAAAPWAAAAVTALFALHPAHVQAVVWISSRKDVLSGMFSLLALWLAVSARRKQGVSAPYAAAALAALLAAMLSKATAISVAPIISLLWVVFWRDIPAPDRRHSQLLWPLASLLLAACVALIFAAIIPSRVPYYFGIEAAARSLAILGWLARLTFSPETRYFFYPVLDVSYLPIMVFFGGAALLAAAVGGVMFLRKRQLASFALIAFLLFCMPSMQLIPYSPPSLVSDHFLFLAVWPSMLLLVVLTWRLNPLPRTALLLAIALAWSFQTFERARDWSSGEALLAPLLRAYPGHYLPAFQKIVNIQLPQGLYRDAMDTAKSITTPEFRDVMVELIKSDHAVSVNVVSTEKPMVFLQNFGHVLSKPPAQSRWNSTMFYVWQYCRGIHASQWDHLAKQFPDEALVRFNAGLWLLNDQLSKDAASQLNQHRSRQAIAHLRAATKSNRLPESMRGTAFYNLGLALLNIGGIAEAEAPLRASLEQNIPDTRAYCLLSQVYKQTGRIEEAGRTQASCPERASNEETAQ